MIAAPLRHLPSLAACPNCSKQPARGGRSRQAEALVFFFDEAHLLFDDAPKALVDKVEQVARLIRSKGVGVYFITQNPADVPDDVSWASLGNRVQHALRAYTPRDRKALRAAAETFRQNPGFRIPETAILEVGVGEALVSTLEKKGVPGVVQRTLVRPPSSRIGPCDAMVRAQAIARNRRLPGFTTRLPTGKAPTRSWPPAPRGKVEEDVDVDSDELDSARRYGGKYSRGKRYTPKKPKARKSSGRSRRSDTMLEAGRQIDPALRRLAARPHGRALAPQRTVPLTRQRGHRQGGVHPANTPRHGGVHPANTPHPVVVRLMEFIKILSYAAIFIAKTGYPHLILRNIQVSIPKIFRWSMLLLLRESPLRRRLISPQRFLRAEAV